MSQTANANQAIPAPHGASSALSGMPAVDDSHARIEEFVRRTVGLRLREQDLDALSRWIAERLRKLALPGNEQYGQLLAEDSAAGSRERERLTVRFTTGESYFFRDQGQFDLLAATILPELIERRARERRLRIWSAGCAAGEEAYSLAMLVDELAPRLAGWNVRILGTDIDAEALNKARVGMYGAWSFRALNGARKQRYFREHGGQWQIDARLRDMVTFRKGDLVRDRFPDPEAGLADLDLILCRNVFIYLDASAVAAITAKFSETLSEGGYLITAHSELFGHDTAPLRVRMFAQSAVFQKIAQPEIETGLGQALAGVPVPTVAALVPALRSEPLAPPAEQRELPAQPPAAPAEDCDRLLQSAWRHADRGMPDAAEQDCRKAIALAALDPRPYYLLAQLAQERGDEMQAKTLLTKVIYLDPSFIAAYLELGTLHAQAGERDRARRMYQTARAALSKLPAQVAVAPYGESTAADILAYVERLLGGSAGEVAGGATTQASLHRSE
jgi:chemotaxis protein methyltransferase CheR